MSGGVVGGEKGGKVCEGEKRMDSLRSRLKGKEVKRGGSG